MIAIVHEAYADLPLDVCKNVWMTAQLVMNQVLLCNGGNNYKLPHVGKLKITANNSRDIPMRLPCHALIAGNHLNADAITTAIISSDQGTPSHLFLIVRFLSMHLIDCCVPAAVAHCDAVPPLPVPLSPLPLWHQLCPSGRRPSATAQSRHHRPLGLRRRRPSCVDCHHHMQPSKRRRGPPWPLPRGHCQR